MTNSKTKSISLADFQIQADANAGVILASSAKESLFKAIVNNTRVTPFGKRIVQWMIEIASRNLGTPIEVSFYYEIWGHDLVHEIQVDADILSGDAMRKLWYNCGVGRYLAHHSGGRDNLGRWSPYVRATTLWISEGDDKYNKNDKALVIGPNLAEIGSYPIQRKR